MTTIIIEKTVWKPFKKSFLLLTNGLLKTLLTSLSFLHNSHDSQPTRQAFLLPLRTGFTTSRQQISSVAPFFHSFQVYFTDWPFFYFAGVQITASRQLTSTYFMGRTCQSTADFTGRACQSTAARPSFYLLSPLRAGFQQWTSRCRFVTQRDFTRYNKQAKRYSSFFAAFKT